MPRLCLLAALTSSAVGWQPLPIRPRTAGGCETRAYAEGPLTGKSIAAAGELGGYRALEFRLCKPFGIVFEEDDGGGIRVAELVDDGNAAALAEPRVLEGDHLLLVGDEDVAQLEFDDAMDVLVAAPGTGTTQLTMAREVDTVEVVWPNGVAVAAKPGTPFQPLAAAAGWGVNYGCGDGACAVCEHAIAGSSRYVRVCVGRVPKGEQVVTLVESERYPG